MPTVRAVLGQGPMAGTCSRTLIQGRTQQEVCTCGHGTKQLLDDSVQLLVTGAVAGTQRSTSSFLLPTGGGAMVGSVQQGHLQS